MRQRMPLSRVFKLTEVTQYGLQSYRICCFRYSVRTFNTGSPNNSPPVKPVPKDESSRLDPVTLHRLKSYHKSYYTRRMIYSSFGVIFGMIGLYITAIQAPLLPPTSKDSQSPDSPAVNHLASNTRDNDPLIALGQERKITIMDKNTNLEDYSSVSTGCSVVPEFPRNLTIKNSSNANSDSTEYQLLGLGVRTVSFLRIQVYVVGIYIALDDISALHNALIKFINPSATTLIPSDKDQLNTMLHDPDISEQIWNSLLGDGVCKMLIRIVPTRNTDFGHLRDAWVRVMTARSQKFGWKDISFGDSVADFKRILAKGSVPKGKEIILRRDKGGEFDIYCDIGKGREKLGSILDERISRSVWLGYLAGKSVACEYAKEAVIASLLKNVETPDGPVPKSTSE